MIAFPRTRYCRYDIVWQLCSKLCLLYPYSSAYIWKWNWILFYKKQIMHFYVYSHILMIWKDFFLGYNICKDTFNSYRTKNHEKTSKFSPICTHACNDLIEENSVLVESRNSSARGRHFFLCPEWRMGLTRYVYMRDLLLSGTFYHIWTLQEFFEQEILYNPSISSWYELNSY